GYDTFLRVRAINAASTLRLTRLKRRPQVAGAAVSRHDTMGQPRARASAASVESGSTATGQVTASSSGMSLRESEKNHVSRNAASEVPRLASHISRRTTFPAWKDGVPITRPV